MLEVLPEGHYRTPPVGGESPIQAAETRLQVEGGVISVKSPLWPEPYALGDGTTFSDPRTDNFLATTVNHQFYQFTTRQLSLVEAYETRAGTSRFCRLGGWLDAAKLVHDVGGTFEQTVQAAVADLGQPCGSHLRGDTLVGDYVNQDTHDQRLILQLLRSGYIDELKQAEVIDDNGYLAGSAAGWIELADPRLPRRYDIVECPRPDGNADRIPFTLHEGVVVHDINEIQEAIGSIIRVETADGERLAVNKIDAGRLIFRLAVKHQSEHWGDPLHRLVEELVIFPDRAAFTLPWSDAVSWQQYYPVDYARTDEGAWFRSIQELSNKLSFTEPVLELAQLIASHQRELSFSYIGNDSYAGPVVPHFVELTAIDHLPRKKIWTEPESLVITLPRPKYRGSVDSLVATKKGLKRTSEEDPALSDFELSGQPWVQSSYIARIAIPAALARDLQSAVEQLDTYWFDYSRTIVNRHPLNRPAMPQELLKDQIKQARNRAIDESSI